MGNHSFYHARLNSFTDDGLVKDIQRAQAAIQEITGVDPRPWFRCPFGVGAESPHIRATLARMGYQQVGCDVDVRDWNSAATAASVAGAMIAGATGRDGCIIQLHSWPKVNSDALTPAVTALQASGAAFVTLDELEQICCPLGGQRQHHLASLLAGLRARR